jgi:Tol biopolymer transport system component
VSGTAHGVILGTAAYMSPEQARGKSVDKRADIFGFGALVFEMLTGRRAFDGETVSDTIASVLKEHPDLNSFPTDTPPALRLLLERCLQKDPKSRLRDIGEARFTIEAIRTGSGVTSPSIAVSSSPGTSPAETGAHAAPAPAAPAPERSGRRTNNVATIGWMVVALVVAVVSILKFGGGDDGGGISIGGSELPVIRALITPEEGSSFHGRVFSQEAWHQVSPDGRTIAFVADEKLWLRPLDQTSAREMTSTGSMYRPFFTLDGDEVGFDADNQVQTMSVGGGPVTTWADAPQFRGGARNREKHTTHRWPRFLPDGEHIIYMAANHRNPRSADCGIHVTSLDGSVNKLVVRSDCEAVYSRGYLLYMRDGNLLAHAFDTDALEVQGAPILLADNVRYSGGSWAGVFSASSGEGDDHTPILTYQVSDNEFGSELVELDMEGNVTRVLGDRDLYWDIALSPDGRSLAVASGNPEPSISIVDLERGTLRRLLFDTDFARSPVWTPDGRRIVYATLGETGRLGVYEVAVQGRGTPVPVATHEEHDIFPQAFSKDGRTLIVDYGDPAQTEVWKVPVEDGAYGEPVPFIQTPPWVQSGEVSPDGRWFLYTSRETGIDQVYVTDFATAGRSWQVSLLSGTNSAWTPDGKTVVFGGAGEGVGDSFYRVSFEVDGNGEPRIGDPVELFNRGNDNSLFVTSAATMLAPAQDRLLMIGTADPTSSVIAITMVVNWIKELEEREEDD